MRKMILSLAVAGTMIMAAAACNSTKNMSDNSDSTAMDTTAVPMDTTTTDTMPVSPDTTAIPPDTTRTP